MDENETRILAAEEAVIALAAYLRPANLLAATAHLEAEAAELIYAGLRRFDGCKGRTLVWRARG